jgi:hypothetical protein
MLNSGEVLNRRLNDVSKENTETCFSQISHHFNDEDNQPKQQILVF